MKIKMSELKGLVKEVLKEETEYQAFFKKALAKFGAKSPADLGDKKKEFFDYVDANWKGKGEKPEKNETLAPVSPAEGNPLKRVKAKKRDQILAQEEIIRKLVREELKFVMFADKGSTTAGHKVKKRQITTGEGV